MYCPSCAGEVVRGLTYCNHCGQRLSEAKVDNDKSSEVRSAFLVCAMVGLFIFGLLAIAVLIGVMKQIAGLAPPFLLAIIVFSFLLMLMIEGVLTLMLVKGKKVEKDESETNQLNERKVKEIYTSPTRELAEPSFQPVSTITEHTTRTLEHVPKDGK
jgi:heme/copper-type cytochrome/quinol oxidase subunit 2